MSSKTPKRRRVEVAVISDVHLGTYGWHAPELLRYLKVLVLNGASATSLVFIRLSSGDRCVS